MSITARNPFELRLSAGAKKLPAAPATTVSSRPNPLAARLIASPRDSRSRTSAAAQSTRTLYWLSSLAAASSLSCERPHRAMSAPTEANPRAMARLIPLPPPVMNAARPRRRSGQSISHNGVFSLLMEDPSELFARSTMCPGCSPIRGASACNPLGGGVITLKKGDLVLLVAVNHADSVDLDTVDLGYELQYRRAVGIALVTGTGRHQLKADAARIERGQPGRDVTLHPAHLPKSALSADDSSRAVSDGQTRRDGCRPPPTSLTPV